jgi:hypothetical protein
MPHPYCYRCGVTQAALPLVYCLDCWSLARNGAFDDLVGATEIASRAAVEPNTVRVWTHRHADFPRPILALAMGQIWRWAEVEAWLKSHRH